MTARKEQYRWAARGFVAPGALLVAVLLYLPLLWTLFLSFTDYNGLGDPKWVGLANYATMFQDPDFVGSLFNTLLWVVGTLIVPVGLGLLLALATYNMKGGVWLQAAVPHPLRDLRHRRRPHLVVRAPGRTARSTRPCNFFGIMDTPRWLLDAPLNTIVMIVAAAWQGVGVNALLFTIGLQSIPKEPLEAARVDGARGFRMFSSMLWPMLRPLTTVVIGLSIVASLKTFDIVLGMTKGGPGRVSETLALTMYNDTFVNSQYGLGSAIAVFLTVVTLLASVLYLRQQLSRKNQF